MNPSVRHVSQHEDDICFLFVLLVDIVGRLIFTSRFFYITFINTTSPE